MSEDYIKWLFEMAGEPFVVAVFPNITTLRLPGYEHSKDIKDFKLYCRGYIWSFLLHKAYDGVNRKYFCEGSRIYPWLLLNTSHGFKVYNGLKPSPEFESSFDSPCSSEDIDKARDAVLEFIFIQEKKNG